MASVLWSDSHLLNLWDRVVHLFDRFHVLAQLQIVVGLGASDYDNQVLHDLVHADLEHSNFSWVNDIQIEAREHFKLIPLPNYNAPVALST